MTNPTPAQIQQVQTNIYNMQRLNDYINQFGQEKITHCFFILTEPDNNNLGLEIMIDILEAVLAVIAAAVSVVAPEFGVAMVAMATMASGALNTWMSQPPPSLNGQFASFLDCFTRSCQQLDEQLAVYHDNVTEYWETPFTFEGNSMTLADLSNSPFPAQDTDDEAFETIAANCILTVDQQVWSYMLGNNYFVSYWILALDVTQTPMVIRRPMLLPFKKKSLPAICFG